MAVLKRKETTPPEPEKRSRIKLKRSEPEPPPEPDEPSTDHSLGAALRDRLRRRPSRSEPEL